VCWQDGNRLQPDHAGGFGMVYRKESLTRHWQDFRQRRLKLLMMGCGGFKVFQRDRSMTLRYGEGLGPQPFSRAASLFLINEHTHSAARMVSQFSPNRIVSLQLSARRTARAKSSEAANFKLGWRYVLPYACRGLVYVAGRNAIEGQWRAARCVGRKLSRSGWRLGN